MGGHHDRQKPWRHSRRLERLALRRRDGLVDDKGTNPKEVIHVSANPKYGSEKKRRADQPTPWLPPRIASASNTRSAARHRRPLLRSQGASPTAIRSTASSPAAPPRLGVGRRRGRAWENLPLWARKQIIEKNIRVYTLPGFEIAREATGRADLQLRMQGNAFLGAFFAVSPMLQEFGITSEQYRDVVRKQYVKKFGKLGEGVVNSNMEVMTQGFELVKEIKIGEIAARDHSSLRGEALLPILEPVPAYAEAGAGESCTVSGCRSTPPPTGQAARPPVATISMFDAEFRSGLGYDQPATPLAAMGVIAAATGDTASKYVARRETPLYIPENCTQCMECISVCPDTALPNTSQDLGTMLGTAIKRYVANPGERAKMLEKLPEIEKQTRTRMLGEIKQGTPLPKIIREVTESVDGFSAEAKAQFYNIIDKVPMAYQKTNAIFSSPERKAPGSGGIFSIFVSDLCKGCAACVTACGDHQALKMVKETEDVNAEHETGTTPSSTSFPIPRRSTWVSTTTPTRPDSKTATLRNMLMVRTNYDALVAGDGACAGCGEKSVLRSIAAVTEAYMRPVYHAKADRFVAKAGELEKTGVAKLEALKAANPEEYATLRQTIAHLILGLGGEKTEDTHPRIAAHEEANGPITDAQLIEAIAAVLLTEAFNHKSLQPIDGRLANGMSVMAMAAHTGCNTVYGSTSPNNPHPYPWMNSLFQDGITVGWLMGESFIVDHARRSVLPERITDIILTREGKGVSPREYYEFTHFTDALMTDQEIVELPKVWVVGGDGGMGDIGYQNMSKVILQNRPNVKAVMLDTQVYSNTGGQNSDSTPMLGGNDMNVFGAATQGKNTEKKTVAETFLAGHGSPFVAQVSMANAPKLYRAILDGLEYRGTMFIQAFTTCPA